MREKEKGREQSADLKEKKKKKQQDFLRIKYIATFSFLPCAYIEKRWIY